MIFYGACQKVWKIPTDQVFSVAPQNCCPSLPPSDPDPSSDSSSVLSFCLELCSLSFHLVWAWSSSTPAGWWLSMSLSLRALTLTQGISLFSGCSFGIKLSSHKDLTQSCLSLWVGHVMLTWLVCLIWWIAANSGSDLFTTIDVWMVGVADTGTNLLLLLHWPTHWCFPSLLYFWQILLFKRQLPDVSYHDM